MKKRVAIAGSLHWIFVNAYGGGAGGCSGYQPAVGTPHYEKAVTIQGTLADGSITVTMEPIVIGDAARTANQSRKVATLSPESVILLDIDQEYRLCVNRLAGYKGILLRWGRGSSGTDTTEIFESYDRNQVLESFYCAEAGVGGLTHRNNDMKFKTCVDIAPFTEEAISMPLDVTIVFRNSVGISEFYHSLFFINAGADAFSGWFTRWWCGHTALCF